MEALLLGILKIIFINIILSGDNAVVIALACRSLPLEKQKKATIWGGVGAVGLRVILTFVAVWLLSIPYFQIVGGLLLIWIAVKLLKGGDDEGHVNSHDSMSAAIKTIIFADLIMSLDNVVAVAGAAEGNVYLIVIGLAISIPLIIWGSQLLMKLMSRFPIIVWLGSALLGYTAGEMILKDEFAKKFLEHGTYVHWVFPLALAGIVLLMGKLLKKK